MEVCDVAIVGGGPSGLTAAIRLHRMGRSVVVLRRPTAQASRVESLTPGVAGILGYLGAADVLSRSAAEPVRRHRVSWATPAVIDREAGDGASGSLVRRLRFDDEFCSAAERLGVPVRASSGPTSVERKDEHLLVRYVENDVERVAIARHVLDATGRQKGPMRRPLGPALVALSGTSLAERGQAQMMVEAVSEGWLWAGRLEDGSLQVTGFTDPSFTHSRWPGEPGRALRALMASSNLFSHLAGTVSLEAVCDAGSYFTEDWLQENWWRIGDAVLSVDPLSSSGVEKSMRFALQAALAANTVLQGGDGKIAQAFLRQRLDDARDRHVAWRQEHYGSCQRWPDAAFWKERRVAQVPVQPVANQPEPSKVSLRELLGVPVVGSAVRFQSTPCALDERIEMKTAVVHPNLGEPVAFVEGVELVPLLQLCLGMKSYPALIDAWSRVLPRERAVRICAWALRCGVLESTAT